MSASNPGNGFRIMVVPCRICQQWSLDIALSILIDMLSFTDQHCMPFKFSYYTDAYTAGYSEVEWIKHIICRCIDQTSLQALVLHVRHKEWRNLS